MKFAFWNTGREGKWYDAKQMGEKKKRHCCPSQEWESAFI